MDDTLRQSQSVKVLLADYDPGEYFCEMLGRVGLLIRVKFANA
jgi:hypothetical protein